MQSVPARVRLGDRSLVRMFTDHQGAAWSKKRPRPAAGSRQLGKEGQGRKVPASSQQLEKEDPSWQPEGPNLP